MVLRSVIGALVAVGVMGAIAAALPERNAGGSKPAPSAPAFGTLPPQIATPAPQAGGTDPSAELRNRQALLTLASAPSASIVTPAKIPSAVAPSSAQAVPSVALPATVPAAPVAQPAPAPVRTAAIVNPAPQPQPAAEPPVTVPAPERPERADGRININKASVEQLNHIPGGGRIGAWIARRRPYRSIEDLVNRRVLREAAFQRIRSSITVD